DDDDEFLYGDSELKESSLSKVPPAVVAPVPSSGETPLSSALMPCGAIPFGKVVPADDELFPPIHPPTDAIVPQTNDAQEEGEDADADAASGDGSDATEESDEDIEFIMEPTSRSLDLRPNKPAARSANSTPQKALPPGPSLTTEYTPRERGGPAKPPAPQPPPPTSTPSSKPLATPNVTAPPTVTAASVSSVPDVEPMFEDGPDPATLPPGRPVFEVDMTALAEKAWRRPGSDLSDWFNYGFDEISWEAYCYRRRELGDLAAVLKTNVVNFSGMPEDQLTQLPPEIRTMVMTGAAAMMANGGAPMMQPGINPMMAPEMGNMNMGPQMIDPMMAGMGGEMGMDGVGVGVGVGVGAPQQGQGFGPQGGMGVGMGIPEYGIQVLRYSMAAP
ncbi:Fip1 motif-domain-containing protein, partial [Russula compacta]